MMNVHRSFVLLLAAIAVLSLPACSSDPITVGGDATAGDAAASRDGAKPTVDGPRSDVALVDGQGHDGVAPRIDGAIKKDAKAAPDGPVACVPRSRKAVPKAPASASWRYGGGHGYPDTAKPNWCKTTTVKTVAQLETALKTAKSGDTVYVADTVELNLTGKSLCIPAGVWLVGGRGRGALAGALLFTNTMSRTPLFKACGSDVRVSGLRFWGADFNQCPPQYAKKTCSQPDRTGGVNCRDCEPSTYGVVAWAGNHRLEVDNCEMAGFSLAAISIADSAGHKIHHNHLHHTQRQGLGYGVVLGGTSKSTTALIENNRFDYYRHAVAASGHGGQEYEARNNLTLEHTIGHVYDMHGLNEKTKTGTSVAGKKMLIYQNAIVTSAAYSFVLRGKPTQGAWFYGNCTARSKTKAVLQRYFTGNFTVDKNQAGTSAPNTYSASFDSCAARRVCYALSGRGPWRNGLGTTLGASTFAVGDFDGDGKDDLFRTSAGKWYWSRSASGAWTARNTSSATLADLRFGDFDGDGKTDVFNTNGSVWRISSGGNTPWKTLRSATEAASSLGFGDFDGDGKTDVLKTSGGKWLWSRSGTAAWASRFTSTVTLSSLRFGDFDGDKKTDAFRSSAGSWYISSGANTAWKKINGSNVGVASMLFGDFDGDKKTDVLRTSANFFYVSLGAATGWKRLTVSSLKLADLRAGDFDGDGKDDILRGGCR